MVRWKRSQDLPTTTTTGVAAVGNEAIAVGGSVKEEEGEWETMFERLKAFKTLKGHCQADRETDDSVLAQWVMSQRRHYVAFVASASGSGHYATTCLTHERVGRLQRLGVDLGGVGTLGYGNEEDSRDDATPTVASDQANNGKRKKKNPTDEADATGDGETHVETRRPPKKRKKSLVEAQKEEGKYQPRRVSAVGAEAEERDAPSHTDNRAASVDRSDGGERDDASPIKEKQIKGRGDSAWETLMNVTALMPPLPTATAAVDSAKPAPAITAPAALVAASPSGSPQTKRGVKSKYGDLDALPNAGCSYSSKYRAANNDVVPNQQRWEDMFMRLHKFKTNHGHCRVPNRFPDDPSLGSWVATQRRYYKNKSLPMPEDRVSRLTELGFEWTTKDPRKVPWETRFEGLRQFKERYGHVDVPHEWEECPQLGFWTANMRQQYRYKQLGKKSSLTDDRIELLNSIGFVWKMQGGRRKKSDPVARPNQSSSPLAAEQAPVVSPPGSAQKMRPLVLDPMSTMGTSSGVATSEGVSVSSYIPPPEATSKQSPGQSTRSVAYYPYQASI
ncbi:helicase [Seminavis robusta]|uniref:Helicase n=1 Tax=Seminavis robusta TaxID=568900 RepID=A0A9N8ETG6_9STRA|nr:helicase [Seminavis robusta]|eukprot:Sro2089_g313960.1 helicase (560) ;mRNA; f:7518-9573